jgi:hypothetical protein
MKDSDVMMDLSQLLLMMSIAMELKNSLINLVSLEHLIAIIGKMLFWIVLGKIKQQIMIKA